MQDGHEWQNKLVLCVFSLFPMNVLPREERNKLFLTLSFKILLLMSPDRTNRNHTVMTNKQNATNHEYIKRKRELRTLEGRNSNEGRREKRRKDPSSHVAGANGVSNGVDQSLPALKTRTHLLPGSPSLLFLTLLRPSFFLFTDETRIITGELSSMEIINIDRSSDRSSSSFPLFVPFLFPSPSCR